MSLTDHQPGIDKRHIAIHEAGHAVASLRFELHVDRITIESDGDSLGFSLRGGCAGDEATPEQNIMESCAGYAALIAAGFDEATAAYGCGNDFTFAIEIIEGWKLGSLDDWKQKTIELMRRPENIRAVELLYVELLKYGTIGPDYAQVVVEVADGDTTEDEFAEYKAKRCIAHGDHRFWLW